MERVLRGDDGEVWLLPLGKLGAQSGSVLSHYEIRAAREAAGLSQRELAELVGVSKNTISNWELGRSTPRQENRLRRVLNVDAGSEPKQLGEATSPPLDDETISAALREASHLQILAELARRIQAAQETGRNLPVIPQVHLEWPMHGATAQDSLASEADSPDRPTS